MIDCSLISALSETEKDTLWKDLSVLQAQHLGNEAMINAIEAMKDMLNEF